MMGETRGERDEHDVSATEPTPTGHVLGVAPCAGGLSMPTGAGGRAAGSVAILAGVMFVVGEALSRIMPDTDDVACASAAAYLVNLVDLLKYGLTGLAVLLLARTCGDQLSRTARIVGRVAAAGFILAGVANGIEHCAHLGAFGAPYVFGLLLGIIATVTFGALLATSRAISTWVGWVISGGVLGFFLSAEQGGAILVGIVWIAVGIRLLTLRSATPVG
jgi:hypothetical protein